MALNAKKEDIQKALQYLKEGFQEHVIASHDIWERKKISIEKNIKEGYITTDEQIMREVLHLDKYYREESKYKTYIKSIDDLNKKIEFASTSNEISDVIHKINEIRYEINESNDRKVIEFQKMLEKISLINSHMQAKSKQPEKQIPIETNSNDVVAKVSTEVLKTKEQEEKNKSTEPSKVIEKTEKNIEIKPNQTKKIEKQIPIAKNSNDGNSEDKKKAKEQELEKKKSSKDVKLAESRESGFKRKLLSYVSPSSSLKIKKLDEYDNKTEKMSDFAKSNNNKNIETYKTEQVKKGKVAEQDKKMDLERYVAQEISPDKCNNLGELVRLKQDIYKLADSKTEAILQKSSNELHQNDFRKFGVKSYDAKKIDCIKKLCEKVKSANSQKEIQNACQKYLDKRRVLRQDFIKTYGKDDRFKTKVEVMKGKEHYIRTKPRFEI